MQDISSHYQTLCKYSNFKNQGMILGFGCGTVSMQFMQKAVFHADYFYIILTCENRHGGESELAETFCRECGIAPSYINVLLMVDNWLSSFDMDEQKLM